MVNNFVIFFPCMHEMCNKNNNGKIFEKFDGYFTPRKNLTLLKFEFFTGRQRDGESFDEFLTRLQGL